MSDLLAALQSVVTALDEAGIRSALVGGLAYSIYVEARATEDLDLLIYPEDWERCVDALRPLGWMEMSDAMDFEKIRMRRLTRIVGEEHLVCDFLLADGELRQGVAAAHTVPLGQGHVHLAPPEVIIVLKKRRMLDRDQGDIEGLERMLREQIPPSDR